MKVFKIQRPDGQFSQGGMRPHFGRKGKVWRTARALSLHLSQLSNGNRNVYDDCVLVEIEIKEEEVSRRPVRELVEEKRRAAVEKAERSRAFQEAAARQARLRQFQELKKEFGDRDG